MTLLTIWITGYLITFAIQAYSERHEGFELRSYSIAAVLFFFMWPVIAITMASGAVEVYILPLYEKLAKLLAK